MTNFPIRRSSSGARQSGDDYQHLVSWNRILDALRSRQLSSVEVEALQAGNVDDLVMHFVDGTSQFAQIRYAVDTSSPLNSEYLMRTRAAGGTSVLQKFFASWLLMSIKDRNLMLITNRALDSLDLILSSLDSRTELLIPAFTRSSPTSSLAMARREWIAHLGCSEDQAIEFLSGFQIRAGRSYQSELETTRILMAAAGFKNDLQSVRQGIDLIRTWVLEGRRQLSVDEVQIAIDGLNLRMRSPAAILHVQSLVRDPFRAEATEELDWVDHYEGSTSAERRRTTDPNVYRTLMQPELADAAERILMAGYSSVIVQGAMRLPSQFAVGAALPKVRNIEILRRQGEEIWATDEPSPKDAPLEVVRFNLDQGTDLAVLVGVTNDPTDDVVAFVRRVLLPVGHLLTLIPEGGPSDEAVSGAANAIAIARSIREVVRKELRMTRGGRVHLFLACPGALAMIMGHRWNRVGTTIVYEDVGDSYEPTFSVPA